MRAFVTGGTGFIGRRLVHKLLERGDQVVALVRNPDKAADLGRAGAELIQGDLTDVDAIRRGAEGSDACFHGAAIYKLGIPKSQHEEMFEANVRGTERVLDAAVQAAVPRIVYVSTINVFGNTRGQVVDESYERPRNGYVSYYDETKFEAHQVALDRIQKGAPIVIVQPGAVLGPGDHSELGNLIKQFRAGRLPLVPFPDAGFNAVYVDDAAEGCILAYQHGEIGESYVLGGEITTTGAVMEKIAQIEGRKPPRGAMPSGLMKAMAPAGRLFGKVMGTGPNMRELISATDGVTYWARDDKARERLGYAPRDLETALRHTVAASE